MAAMFVAKGHGLMEVRIPNHRADPTPITNSVMVVSPGKGCSRPRPSCITGW
jgi:hypothetical protein